MWGGSTLCDRGEKKNEVYLVDVLATFNLFGTNVFYLIAASEKYSLIKIA